MQFHEDAATRPAPQNAGMRRAAERPATPLAEDLAVSRAAEGAAMRRAIELAASPDFVKGPNPRVGCVLLDETGRTVAEGWHRGTGQPHAEAAALAAAGAAARGTTAIVTLEPCRHHGRTGPCSQALIAAGVRRVVWAVDDPNPAAAGGGAELQAAGLETASGLLTAEAAELNRSWLFAQRHGRPLVTWKVAGTLDGRAAAADGSSRWISSPIARADVHRLRATAGAILTGTGSVLTDNSQLSARDQAQRPLQRAEQPLRVVVGRRIIPPTARIFDETAETIQVRSHRPAEVLAELTARGIHDVLIEGGPTVAAAFLRAGLVDRVIAYLAPVLLGSGTPVIGNLGVSTISDALRLEVEDITVLGSGAEANVRITAAVPLPANVPADRAEATHGGVPQPATTSQFTAEEER